MVVMSAILNRKMESIGGATLPLKLRGGGGRGYVPVTFSDSVKFQDTVSILAEFVEFFYMALLLSQNLFTLPRIPLVDRILITGRSCNKNN